MKRTLRILFSLTSLLTGGAGCGLLAQSVSPTLIGSTGNFSTVPGLSISSSVGEPITTTVSSGTLTLTQGFQQPQQTCPVFLATASDSTICEGTSIILAAVDTNFMVVPVFNYSWVPAVGLNCSSCQNTAATPTTTTNYTVYINNGFCYDTAFVTVSVSPSMTATISGQNSICLGNSTTLTATVTGGIFPYTYVWNGPSYSATAVNVTVSPTAPSIYTVTITDVYGCTALTNYTVTVNPNPFVSVSPPSSTICAGQSATLTASGGNWYSWSTGDTTTTITVFPTGTTVYTATVTNSFGCTSSATGTVSVNALPVASISVAPSFIICSGNAVTLTASGGGTYLWVPGGQTTASIVVNPLVPTTYSVIVTMGNCPDTASVNIAVLPAPAIFGISASPSAICPGDSSLLTVNAPAAVSYLWNPGGLNGNPVQVFPMSSSVYSVIVTGTNNCTNSATVAVTVNEITADAGPDITICPGFAVHLKVDVQGNAVWYYWYPEVQDSAVPNPAVTPDSTTTYFVEVMNASGCWAIDSITIIVNRDPLSDCKSICDSIYNGITPNGDRHNDEWWLNGITSFPENNVAVFNRWGQHVWFHKNYDNKEIVWKGTNEDGEKLPPGTYYYVIEYKIGDRWKTCTGWVEISY